MGLAFCWGIEERNLEVDFSFGRVVCLLCSPNDRSIVVLGDFLWLSLLAVHVYFSGRGVTLEV